MSLSSSFVWQLVKKIDKSQAECNHCGKTYALGGGTSSLGVHLKNQHADIIKPSSSGIIQSKIEPHTRPCEPKRREKLKSMIANLVIRDLRPLSFVCGDAFKALMGEVEPNLKNFGRKAVANIIKKQYEEKMAEIQEELKSCDCCSISITIDGWVSQSNDGNLTVTAHFINKKWNLVDLNLATCGFEDRHTGENIKEAVKEIKNDFNISKMMCVFHDNALNMGLAMRHLNENDIIKNDIGCFAHTLQLALKNSIEKNAPVEHMLAVVCSNSRFFRKSNVGWGILKKKQKEAGGGKTLLGPIMDVAVCWNSAFLMVQRMLASKPFIDNIWRTEEDLKRDMKKANVLKFRDDHWLLARKFVKLLEPFYEMTCIWSGLQYITLTTAFPIIIAQTEQLKTREWDLPGIYTMKEKLKNSLTDRFDLLNDTDDVNINLGLIACFLDPRFKNLVFITENRRQIVKNHIINLLEDMEIDSVRDIVITTTSSNDEQEGNSDSDSDLEAPKKKKTGLSGLLGAFYQEKATDPNKQSSQEELRSYMDCQQIATIAEPMDWWVQNESQFPRISHLAKAYLAIPATSVLCEQSFSKAGYITENRRSRLSSKHVREILFLHYNTRHSVQKKLLKWEDSSDDESVSD